MFSSCSGKFLPCFLAIRTCSVTFSVLLTLQLPLTVGSWSEGGWTEDDVPAVRRRVQMPQVGSALTGPDARASRSSGGTSPATVEPPVEKGLRLEPRAPTSCLSSSPSTLHTCAAASLCPRWAHALSSGYTWAPAPKLSSGWTGGRVHRRQRKPSSSGQRTPSRVFAPGRAAFTHPRKGGLYPT